MREILIWSGRNKHFRLMVFQENNLKPHSDKESFWQRPLPPALSAFIIETKYSVLLICVWCLITVLNYNIIFCALSHPPLMTMLTCAVRIPTIDEEQPPGTSAKPVPCLSDHPVLFLVGDWDDWNAAALSELLQFVWSFCIEPALISKFHSAEWACDSHRLWEPLINWLSPLSAGRLNCFTS